MSYYSPNFPYPGEDRNIPPFEIKDVVRMDHEGYSMRHGDTGEVERIQWVTSTGWCISVRSITTGRSHSYRAARFKFVEKGKTIMKPFYIIYETFKSLTSENGFEVNFGTVPHVVHGNETDVRAYLKELLAKYPDKKYAFGYICKIAQTDMPPVKIINL